jgi:hypothetical protein
MNTPKEHPLAAPSASRFPDTLPIEKQFFVGLPCYGAQMTQPFVMSLIQTLQQSPFMGQLEFITNDSLVSRARNTIVGKFLESKYDWLLFLDVDLQFEVEHIARLWLHGTKEGRKIVCGIYSMKKLAPMFVANFMPGEVPDSNGAVKVSESGTGCMLIHRSVFTAMARAMPELSYITDFNHSSGGDKEEFDFFGVGPYLYKTGPLAGKRRYLSEDWMFCQRARDIGFDVWADTKIQIRHMGNMVYPPDVKEVHTAMKTYRAMGAAGCPDELV